jgi:formiminoglutamate deiminase
LTSYLCELAVIGDPARGEVGAEVILEVVDGLLVQVTTGSDRPKDAVFLPGVTIPGLANVHSHAFHRALRGRSESGPGDFWSWREQMYAVAGRLDPESYFALARALFAEMALSGVTTVGEFHYLHHQRGGKRYEDSNAMGNALISAAAQAGIRITLLDACYLKGGFDRELEGVQRRFGDRDVDAWAERVDALKGGPLARIGAAAHSVRAVDPPSIGPVATWARDHKLPLHVHLSEQRAENEACLQACGRTPTRLLADEGVLGPLTTAVHATHLQRSDVELLGSERTTVCLCPTTERDLADGVGPARALANAGSPLSVGSDSHAVVDLFEEARGIELDERLVRHRRGIHSPRELFEAATAAGHRALGWPETGRLAPGSFADFVTVNLNSTRLAGTRPDAVVASLVFAATSADVTDVVIGGRRVVAGGRHQLIEDPGLAMSQALALLDDRRSGR